MTGASTEMCLFFLFFLPCDFFDCLQLPATPLPLGQTLTRTPSTMERGETTLVYVCALVPGSIFRRLDIDDLDALAATCQTLQKAVGDYIGHRGRAVYRQAKQAAWHKAIWKEGYPLFVAPSWTEAVFLSRHLNANRRGTAPWPVPYVPVQALVTGRCFLQRGYETGLSLRLLVAGENRRVIFVQTDLDESEYDASEEDLEELAGGTWDGVCPHGDTLRPVQRCSGCHRDARMHLFAAEMVDDATQHQRDPADTCENCQTSRIWAIGLPFCDRHSKANVGLCVRCAQDPGPQAVAMRPLCNGAPRHNVIPGGHRHFCPLIARDVMNPTLVRKFHRRGDDIVNLQPDGGGDAAGKAATLTYAQARQFLGDLVGSVWYTLFEQERLGSVLATARDVVQKEVDMLDHYDGIHMADITRERFGAYVVVDWGALQFIDGGGALAAEYRDNGEAAAGYRDDGGAAAAEYRDDGEAAAAAHD